jgi:hypothetical protein
MHRLHERGERGVGRTFANSPSVVRIVTFSERYPPPCGVVIGPLRNVGLRRIVSHASGVMPVAWPCS